MIARPDQELQKGADMTRRRSPARPSSSRLGCTPDESGWRAAIVIVVMVLVVVLTARGLGRMEALEVVLIAGWGGIELARRLIQRNPGHRPA
ncbi:hypothetical protein [Nonomuraea sp. B19D2]|uniref:hypothetical protein n=1 Tax=Nonomuraea sp. B19D2 TaxID=3159561 RepID=UPI0032DB5535